jgi:hypothetical protein
MNVGFIIESSTDEDFVRLSYAAQEAGHRIVTLEKYQDYVWGEDRPAVFFGSINAVKFHGKKNWVPGVWSNWGKLRCSSYYAYLGPWLLQSEYVILPLAEVQRRRGWLFSKFANEGLIFIRPDGNDKPFHGERVSENEFSHWWKVVEYYSPGPECLCVVSKPSKIDREYRTIVSDGKVITSSVYRMGREIIHHQVMDAAINDFVESVLGASRFAPHPIFVVDVAVLEDGNMRIIEVGSVNSCGFYQCDVRPIIQEVARHAITEWESLKSV